MPLDEQVTILGVVAVFCSAVCGAAAVFMPARFRPLRSQVLPVPRPARHACDRPVDTPSRGIRGPLRSAGPQRAPDTLYIDPPAVRPYIGELVVQNRRADDAKCGLCWDGREVIGEACMLCGSKPVMQAAS